MPGIDYQRVKQLITMGDVLNVLRWKPFSRKGAEERGCCPFHRSTNPRSRSFAVNRNGNKFQCFSCGAKGNQIELFARVVKLDLYAATVELCRCLKIDVPYLETPEQRRGASRNPCDESPDGMKRFVAAHIANKEARTT